MAVSLTCISTLSLRTVVKEVSRAWEVLGRKETEVLPGEAEKYLGVRVDLWKGIQKLEMIDELQTWICRIGKAPLKPWQKVVLLNSVAIPQLIFQVDHWDFRGTKLAAMDGMIKLHQISSHWTSAPGEQAFLIDASNSQKRRVCGVQLVQREK
ncbi:reverse transcriptase [Arapaima gigas]